MNQAKVSANEKVTNYILEQIRNRKLVEGSKLPTEIELSQSLSVGRNAVREALKTLQFIELVQSSQGSGYKLSPSFNICLKRIVQFLLDMGNYSSKDIRNTREALELKVVQSIQQNRTISESDIAFLNECIDKMEKRESPQHYDTLFHCTLASLSGNLLISTIIDTLSKLSESYVEIPWDNISDEDAYELVIRHRKIVECLTQTYMPSYLDNAITQHYNVADRIIARKKSSEDLTLDDILDNCKTEEDLLRAIGDLWRTKKEKSNHSSQ